MTKKELAEILKYSSPNELWIVSELNSLIKLECPFEVIALNDIGLLKKWQIVNVIEVKVTAELKTVFIIEGQAYYYFYFEILT